MISLGFVNHPLDDRFVRGTELERWTLELLAAGRIQIETAQGRRLATAAAVLLAPPRTAYAVEWAGGPGPWTEIYAIFSPPAHWNALLSRLAPESRAAFLDLHEAAPAAEVESALQAALMAYRSTRVHRQLLAQNHLERALLALDEFNPAGGQAPRDARVQQALEYIAAQFHEPLQLETLAQQVYLSPSRFSHLFKLQMGQSPMRYLEQYRLERAAAALLSTDASIEQVAHAAGFPNAFHFSTRFRRHFGRPPRRYRQNPKEI